MDAKILKLSCIEKKYDGGFRLCIDELYLEKNKILSIIGPNGSGKSTLIKLINLLEKPDRGSIYFEGKEISNGNVNHGDIRKEMAVVFQEPIFFNTSAYNNILLGLKMRKTNIPTVKDRIDHYVKKLKIGDLLHRNIRTLSGGEKKRLSLVRSLVLDYKLLLLDEPLANIDQYSRESLMSDLFTVLKSIGKSIIYITHNRDEAMMLADDIAVINKGRVEQSGRKEEIFRNPASEFVAGFVGVETLIYGAINKKRGKVCEVRIGDHDIKVFAVGEFAPGTRVALAIRPEAVILYNNDMQQQGSSAMNLFKGKITEIRDLGILKKIEIDCGFDLVSFVTPDSVDRLELSIGKDIYAGVKASSIHLFKK